MSQDALDEATGIEQSQISRMERGEAWPTLEEVDLFERALGLAKGTLIFASGAATPAISVVEAIRQDPALSPQGKDHLVRNYEFTKMTDSAGSILEEDDESSDASEGEP